MFEIFNYFLDVEKFRNQIDFYIFCQAAFYLSFRIGCAFTMNKFVKNETKFPS